MLRSEGPDRNQVVAVVVKRPLAAPSKGRDALILLWSDLPRTDAPRLAQNVSRDRGAFLRRARTEVSTEHMQGKAASPRHESTSTLNEM